METSEFRSYKPAVLTLNPKAVRKLDCVKLRAVCLEICGSCVGYTDHEEFMDEIFPLVLASIQTHFDTIDKFNDWLSDVRDCIDIVDYFHGYDWYAHRCAIVRQRHIPAKILRVYPSAFQYQNIFGYTLLRIYSMIGYKLNLNITDGTQ